MASALEIAGYRKTHSVAETCARFGIKERAVYKACAKAREEQLAHAVTITGTTQARQVRIVRRPHTQLHGQVRLARPQRKVLTVKDPLDEVAGEDTDWQCPYTGEVFPIIPGTTKRMWLADRRTVYVLQSQKKTTASAETPLCEAEKGTPVPVLQEDKQGGASAPALPENVAPVPPAPVHLHQQAPQVVYVKQYVRVGYHPRLLPRAAIWVYRNGPPWQVVLGFMLGLLLILLCSV